MKKKTLQERLVETLVNDYLEDIRDLPIGVKHLERVQKRLDRLNARIRKPKKPEPWFRQDLVARQKKARPKYERD